MLIHPKSAMLRSELGIWWLPDLRQGEALNFAAWELGLSLSPDKSLNGNFAAKEWVCGLQPEQQLFVLSARQEDKL